jgi:CubicO group peptidase (beta-lactamase class C family)
MEFLKAMDKLVKIVICVIILVIIGITAYMERGLFTTKKQSPEVEKIQSYLSQQVDKKNFSGCVFVEKKGKILVNEGYGMANYELNVSNTTKTKFNIGSITKTFTATAIMQLVEKNKISLEDTIDKYIQGYPNGNKISISQLLSHKSGIPDFTDFSEFMDTVRLYKTPQQLIDGFKNKPLEFEPGTKYKYSNSGYVLLAYIIEKVTGQTYEDYLNENILKPLEMNDTEIVDAKKIVQNRASGYTVSNKKIIHCDMVDNSYEFGAGGIYSTVEDLYKWYENINSVKILSKDSWNKMLTPNSEFYGYGWITGDMKFDDVKKKVIGHNGLTFGFSSDFLKYVDDDLVIIVLSNFENFKAGSLADQVGTDIVKIVDGTY